MADQAEILTVLNASYALRFDRLEFLRDGGSMAYAAYANGHKFFLRVTKPAFYDTVLPSTDIHVYLLERGFPVPPIVFTRGNLPYVQVNGGGGKHFYILYEYIEGREADASLDAEQAGALAGRLHGTMKACTRPLVKRDKHFYIGRYLDILKRKQYPRAESFAEYGEILWERIKDLPRGYCHGDMHAGNFLKTPGGQLYLLDFDTSCEGFSMYDPALFCNQTDYFTLEEDGRAKSKSVFDRFLPEYLRHNSLSTEEADALYSLIALYHFTLQATMIELYGPDCVDNGFFDKQLDWLLRWRTQCGLYFQ